MFSSVIVYHLTGDFIKIILNQNRVRKKSTVLYFMIVIYEIFRKLSELCAATRYLSPRKTNNWLTLCNVTGSLYIWELYTELPL